MVDSVLKRLNIQFFAGDPDPVPTPTPNPAPIPSLNDTTVPKYRFDEVSQRAQAAEAKVAELTAQVKSIEEKDKKIEELTKALSDTKAGYELEKTTMKKQNAIEAALKDKVVDLEVVNKLLNLDKITFNEQGEVAGLEEQVKTLQTSKPYLWKAAKKVAEPGAGGKLPGEKTFAQKLAENKNAQNSITAKGKTYF